MIRKSLRLVFASFVIIGGTAVMGFAQNGEHQKPKSINERQDRQRERIRDGVQDGDINKRELGRLAHEQAQIRRQERVFRADGDLTRGERARLQRNLNQAGRHIRRASRN